MRKYICDMCESRVNIGNKQKIEIGFEGYYDVCFDCAKKVKKFVEEYKENVCNTESEDT